MSRFSAELHTTCMYVSIDPGSTTKGDASVCLCAKFDKRHQTSRKFFSHSNFPIPYLWTAFCFPLSFVFYPRVAAQLVCTNVAAVSASTVHTDVAASAIVAAVASSAATVVRAAALGVTTVVTTFTNDAAAAFVTVVAAASATAAAATVAVAAASVRHLLLLPLPLLPLSLPTNHLSKMA